MVTKSRLVLRWIANTGDKKENRSRDTPGYAELRLASAGVTLRNSTRASTTDQRQNVSQNSRCDESRNFLAPPK